MDFAGKVAVITGGASGIGRAVALALAGLGADIVLADTDDARLEEAHREIYSTGRRALAVHCDVSKTTDVANLAAQTVSTLGAPDILMNNAGIQIYGKPEKMGPAEYELIFDINVLGAIRGVLAFLPHMLAKGSGYIINTSSRAGFNGDARPYSISKYSLIGYSEGLYCDLRPRGIMVSVLCPGVVKTNLPEHSPIVGNEQEIEETRAWLQQVPDMPDILSPDNVARIVIEGMIERRFLILTPGTEDFLAAARERGRDLVKLEEYLQENYKD